MGWKKFWKRTAKVAETAARAASPFNMADNAAKAFDLMADGFEKTAEVTEKVVDALLDDEDE